MHVIECSKLWRRKREREAPKAKEGWGLYKMPQIPTLPPKWPRSVVTFHCDCKCNYLHPIACRDSIKSREFAREICRFYHLKGTKKPISVVSPQSQTQIPVQNQSMVQQHTQTLVPTPVQNQTVPNPIFNSIPAQQVFQSDQSAVLSMLQLMMEEMRSWRNQAQTPLVQPLLRPQIYSQGSEAP